MANLQSGEGSSARDASGESSESTLQLNIKTLDSRICSFHVDKNVSSYLILPQFCSQNKLTICNLYLPKCRLSDKFQC